MSKCNGAGKSFVTNIKQKNIGEYINLTLKLVPKIINKWAKSAWPGYFYFDLNAGPGLYDDGLLGSPIIFLRALLQKIQIDRDYNILEYPAMFILCEKNIDCVMTLAAKIYEYLDEGIKFEVYENNKLVDYKEGNFKINGGGKIIGKLLIGDNNITLKHLLDNNPKLLKKKCFGIIYNDPNGIFDVELLSWVSEQYCFTTTDIVINCNASAIKRAEKAFGYDKLKTKLKSIRKKYWVVREPYGPMQWSLLIGSNWKEFPAFKGQGFYHIDTSKGKEIFDRLNFTSEELGPIV